MKICWMNGKKIKVSKIIYFVNIRFFSRIPLVYTVMLSWCQQSIDAIVLDDFLPMYPRVFPDEYITNYGCISLVLDKLANTPGLIPSFQVSHLPWKIHELNEYLAALLKFFKATEIVKTPGKTSWGKNNRGVPNRGVFKISLKLWTLITRGSKLLRVTLITGFTLRKNTKEENPGIFLLSLYTSPTRFLDKFWVLTNKSYPYLLSLE